MECAITTDPQLFRQLKSTESALLRTLSKVRNTMQAHFAVNCLPDDILRAIFIEIFSPLYCNVPLPVAGFAELPNSQLDISPQLCIASVCRRWREVATSCSALWSTIAIRALSNPSRVALQLRYSGSAPIDLQLCVGAARDPANMHVSPSFDWDALQLKSMLPRLRSFHLHSPLRGADGLFEQLTEPAPLLERLTLTPLSSLQSGAPMPYGYAEPPVPPNPALPRLFHDTIPWLRSLRINRFVSWPGNSFRNLTCLSLNNQRGTPALTQPMAYAPPPAGRCTRSFLVDFLNNSPGLQELHLASTFNLVHDGSTAQIVLRCLQILIVTEWDHASASIFFAALEIPVFCLVYLRHLTVNGLSFEVGSLWQRLSMPKMADFLQGMTRLYLRCNFMRPSYPPHVLACGRGGLYLEATNYGSAWTDPSQLPSTADHIRLYSATGINELWVDILASTSQLMTTTQWAEVYSAMPGITKLVIIMQQHSEVNTESDFPYLLALCAQQGDQPRLPNLTELHLIYTKNITGAPLSALQHVKAYRDAVGMPIGKLVVGAQPPLELYEETIQDVRGVLGPDAVCGIQDLSFNWSPFSERRPYSGFWPLELLGRFPGLWDPHT